MHIDSAEFNLEILKMARDIVTNEYLDKKAQEHNKWLAESDTVWKSKRSYLAYPSFPPFPDETIIVARARTLMDFLKQDAETIKCDKASNIDKQELTNDISGDTIVLPDEAQETNVEVPDMPTQLLEMRVNRGIDDRGSISSGRVMPSVLKKLEELKRALDS